MGKDGINFRIITNDVKVIDIDSDCKAVVGTAASRELKTLILSILTSGKMGKAHIKGMLYVLLSSQPDLWDYLGELKEKVDAKEH